MATLLKSKDVQETRRITRQSKNPTKNPIAPVGEVPLWRSHRNSKRTNYTTTENSKVFREIGADVYTESPRRQYRDRVAIGHFKESSQHKHHLQSKTTKSWQNRRHKGASEQQGGSSVEVVHCQSSSDSEPVRPAKRRRKSRGTKQIEESPKSSPTEPRVKRPRKFRCDIGANTFNPRPDLLVRHKDEIEDSYEVYEDEIEVSTDFACVAVEIPIYHDFDKGTYAKVSVSSSQSTQIILPADQDRGLGRLQGSPNFQPLPNSIPDSQDLLDLSSYGESVRSAGTTCGERGQRVVVSETPEAEQNHSRRFSRLFQRDSSVEEDQLRPAQTTLQSTRHSSSLVRQDTSFFGLGELEEAPKISVELSPKGSVELGYTGALQGAQIEPILRFSTSRSSKGLNFEIFEDNLADVSLVPSQEQSQETTKSSVLSQREVNSQRSASHRTSPQNTTQGKLAQKKPVGDLHRAKSRKAKRTRRRVSNGKLHSIRKRPSRSFSAQPLSNDRSATILPQRPQTPVESSMTDLEDLSNSSKLSYAEQAKAARNKVRAMFQDPPELLSIEHYSPSLPSHISGQVLPVRENPTEAASPDDRLEETPEEKEADKSDEFSLRLPKLKPNEYFVLLPIVSMVQDIYKRAIMKRKREIQAFLSSENLDTAVLKKMDMMIEELKLLTDHQDLITDFSFTQQNVSDEHQAKWAATCSSKCLFIQNLLSDMRRQEKHIVIFVRPGRMLDILESILKAYGYIYERPDCGHRSKSGAVGPLHITLLPTGLGHDGEGYVVSWADAIIAFDESCRASERYSRISRSHLHNSEKLSPLISLVVANSAEHIDLCLSKNLELVERKKSLVDFVTQTREEVGNLDPKFPHPENAAARIAQYLQTGLDSNTMWPLPEYPDIVGLQAPSLQQTQQASKSTTLSQDPQSLHATTPHGTMKRTLRAESVGGSDVETTKRIRMTPTPGDISSSGDVTRVSDSVSSQSRARTFPTTAATLDVVAQMSALDVQQTKQITSLLEKVDELEARLQSKETTEERLRKMVKDLETRLDDHVSTIKKFQPKLQQAIVDRGKFQAERDTAKAQAETLTAAMSLRNRDIAKLREEKTALEQELKSTRTALAKSSVPEAAALAEAQEKAFALQVDKDRLEKRTASVQRDFDFTRDMYQKASSYTTELNNEVSELKDLNTILARKASENTVRIAEIQRSQENLDREQRIAELEALLRDRELELRKKSEELKAKTNGRRETRGTSVPRSPRMGASGAMSPRPGFGRQGVGSNRSRGVSPAEGGFTGGKERDPLLFPPSVLGNSARWGHLQ